MSTSASDTDSLLPDPRRGFEGKVALITGGSRGIGRALALRLAARGATADRQLQAERRRRRPTPSPRSQRLGAAGLAIRADLEIVEEIEAMFEEVQERFGRLDFFVSNASASKLPPTSWTSKPHHLERTFNA